MFEIRGRLRRIVGRGGEGSGYFAPAHKGRLGEVGGSTPSGEAALPPIERAPTDFLVRGTLEDARLPARHYDGLAEIRFVQGTYVQTKFIEGISEAYGTYNWYTHRIMLAANPKPLDPENATAFGGNIAVYGGATVLHEIGHHVHLQRLTDEAAGQWQGISRDGGSATISAYAQTNTGEHFAEAYRAYTRGGDQRRALRNREPRAYAFMRSIMREDSPLILPSGIYPPGSTSHSRYWGGRQP